LAGLAAGAAVGVLFAPEKGSETRKRLVQRGNGLARNARNSFNELTERGAEKMEDLKGSARNLTETSRSRQDDGKRDLKTT